MRGSSNRQMPLAAQKTRGRVEADPAGAWNVDLGPGVQVGEIVISTRGAVERFYVRAQLNEVAGDKTSRHAEVAQDLDEQPPGVATRAGTDHQRLVGRLHTWLHACNIADLVLELAVKRDKIIYGVRAFARQRGEESLEQRTCGLRFEERRQIGAQMLRKVERIDDVHVGHEVDGNRKLSGLFGKYVAGKPVAVGVLLPIHEMLGRQHLEGIAFDRRAAMGGRAQADHLRTETDGSIVTIV